MSERTFKVQTPLMQGSDVRGFRRSLNAQMRTWNVDYRIPESDEYDAIARDLAATVCHGLGLSSAKKAMAHGVTPQLRTKLRHKRQTPAEKVRYRARAPWRRRLRARHEDAHVHPPLAKILQHSWGYQEGHDGVDLICVEDAPLYAICDAKVIDVRAKGWWGVGAQPSPGHPVSEGDGVIQIRCIRKVGPFEVGLDFVYGHAERATVEVGDTVKAGQVIGRAGYARAPHVHFCANDDPDLRGVGDRDPWPFVAYAMKHAS